MVDTANGVHGLNAVLLVAQARGKDLVNVTSQNRKTVARRAWNKALAKLRALKNVTNSRVQ
jgi:hypothetical protein